MAGITLAQAEAKLTMFLTAEDTVSSGKSYSIGDRSMTRHDLSEIRQSIAFWDRKVKELTESAAGRGRARTVAPGGW